MWLILGGDGQLGRSLQSQLELNEVQFTAVGRKEVDITKSSDITAVVKDLSPNVIVNCAAWTAVDDAEDHEDEAHAVNCLGAHNVASTAAAHQTTLVHISTDYVFAGISSVPFLEDDQPSPVSAYGRTKLAGENAVRLAHPDGAYIIRTAWLYSQYGHNFAKTMVRRALTQQPVRVVNDQRGQPTLATDLARHIIELVLTKAPIDTYHGTNSGECTWFDFASEIYRLAGTNPAMVSPVPSTEYPTRATRPLYSVLSHSNTEKTRVAPMRSWLEALTEAMPHIIASTEQE